MNRAEKISLLTTSKPIISYNSSRETANNGYLLLSIPEREDESFIRKLRNYSGTIAAVSMTVLVFIIIAGISYHTDISELVQTNNKLKQHASPTRELTVDQSNQLSSKEIETPLGRLKGYIRRSRKGRDFVSFYKVPYAKPPIGELRFKDPQPVEKWDGIRDFEDVRIPSCIQKSKHVKEHIATGDEDCLYSNIYVPNYTGNPGKFPVMVYFHGGGFGDGNGSRFGPDYFMDEDVVLIILENRLGLLGFLNTGDKEATGNMGFKDQVMLLKWTQNYISYFNGDEESVTIFGNSFGGHSVSFLLISPMARGNRTLSRLSKGLFHRAISQSGTVLCDSANLLDLKPEVTKQAVAKAFNCSLESSAALLDCLRDIDAADLALLQKPDIKYALTVEQGFDANNLANVFMPDKPYDLLKAGKVNRVPYIIGIVSTEWTGALDILKSVDFTNEINTNFSQYAPELLGMDLNPEEIQTIRNFYFKNKPISNDTERNLTNLVSDRIMAHGTKVTADLYSPISETYLYYLSKPARKSYAYKLLVDFPNLDKTGFVAHADEVQFLFPYVGYPEYPVTDTEYFPFSEFFVKLWVQFAATGKPRIEGRLTDWEALNTSSSSDSNLWYELNDYTGVTTVLQERMRFWDRFSHKKLMYEL